MKKVLIVLLTMIIVSMLFSCGDNSSNDSINNNDSDDKYNNGADEGNESTEGSGTTEDTDINESETNDNIRDWNLCERTLQLAVSAELENAQTPK